MKPKRPRWHPRFEPPPERRHIDETVRTQNVDRGPGPGATTGDGLAFGGRSMREPMRFNKARARAADR
ncbi:MAG: hypothetical protein Q7J25_13510, partial [Vicinamibacterales bacterium]|nr:hypothetical protein [Vicinamibacterales bacterium]